MGNVPQKVQERVVKLREAIDKYRYEYHVLDKEDLSPEALDSLKDELSKEVKSLTSAGSEDPQRS